MKRLSPFWVVAISIMLITVAGGLLSTIISIENFGAQGGELVQLSTSHVPTQDDVDDWKTEQKQVKKEIIDMTGYW